MVFDAPTKDWAARRTTPTIDVYLYDIREDLRRRQLGMTGVRDAEGKVVSHRQPPRFFKLSYLLTAWTQRPEDEHRLKTTTQFESWDAYQAKVRNGYHHQAMRNMLQRNDGDGTFTDVGQMAGVLAHRILEGWDFSRSPVELLDQIAPALDTELTPERDRLRPAVAASLTAIFTAFGWALLAGSAHAELDNRTMARNADNGLLVLMTRLSLPPSGGVSSNVAGTRVKPSPSSRRPA